LSAIILGAKKTVHKDEFDISIPPTLNIKKYTNVVDYFNNNWDYDNSLETTVAGVPHVYGTGGIHGAIQNYFGKGEYLHVDVNSYYPSLMLCYPDYCMSRTGASVTKFQEIKDNRIVFKKQGDQRADALKIVLNSTYGAMKDTFNSLYDPRSANNVCIFGQLLLTDLIERLEGSCQLIQSNTDGLIIKVNGNREEVISICKEWEERTGMGLGYEIVDAIWQKDVNNYIILADNGKVKSKGAYVSQYHRARENDRGFKNAGRILDDAVVDYFIKGIKPEETINNCDDIFAFQLICKAGGSYSGTYWPTKNGDIKVNKVNRVYASKDKSNGHLYKLKINADGTTRKDSIANLPDHCLVDNGAKATINDIDKQWYIDIAYKRISDYKGE
jgi:DNA polymerase